MTALSIHALLYLAVNALLVLLWLLLGGEVTALTEPFTAAREEGFWPLFVAAPWAVLLGLHAGLTVVIRVGAARRREKREARERTKQERQQEAAGKHWITAMFTDIVGSTTLAATLGDDAYSEVLAEHRRTVRGLVDEHGGSVVGTQGDGFLLRFGRPEDAVGCAVALQRRIADERAEDAGTPQVRVGIHAGQVVARDGDVVGQMVNLAARVADQAGADEIVVTEAVIDHTPDGLELEDLGLRSLDGVAAPRHLLALRWDRRPSA